MKLKLLSIVFCLIMALTSQQSNAYTSRLKKKEFVVMKKSTSASTFFKVEKPFNIKLNLWALGFRNVSLFGEYAFHKNMSIQVGFRYMLPTSLINSYTKEMLQDTLGIKSATINGFAITPEFRFYPGKHAENPAPHGFYIGLYGRMTSNTLNVTKEFNGGFGNRDIDFSLKFKQMTAGFIIGKQFARKSVTFDWWILAAGAGGTSSITASVSDPIFGDVKTAKTLDALDKNIDLPAPADMVKIVTKGDVNTSTQTAKVSLEAPGFNIRALLLGGMCIGYHF